MIYAQFFHTDLSGKLAEACGDRSVIILDGRFCHTQHRQWAREECLKRGYEAWQLMKGQNFTRSRPISEIVQM